MKGTPPTDLELMLYADGELDGERLAEVEAWLEGDRDGRTKLSALDLVSGVVREQALATSSRAGDLAGAIMDRLDPTAAPIPVVKAPPPPAANDNGRTFFFIAAALVAAAAAVGLWLRPAPSVDADGRVAQTLPAEIPALGYAPAPAHSAGPTPDADLEHGVEVAAIDFGSTTGAVFYVPNGTSPSDTTTVVWLSDDAAGEDE